MTDDRSRGVHLTEKQLVFVFMAGTVVAVVVFLCGVLVGRGVQAGRGASPDAAMITPSEIVSDGGADAAAEPPGAAGVRPADRLGAAAPPEQVKAPPAAPPVTTPPAEAIVPPEAPEEAGGAGDAEAADGLFTVQLAAVTKRSEADAIAKRFTAKGYEAFVLVPEPGEKVRVFRVRVGSFKTKREAESLAQRLAREDKRYPPWVTTR